MNLVEEIDAIFDAIHNCPYYHRSAARSRIIGKVGDSMFLTTETVIERLRALQKRFTSMEEDPRKSEVVLILDEEIEKLREEDRVVECANARRNAAMKDMWGG